VATGVRATVGRALARATVSATVGTAVVTTRVRATVGRALARATVSATIGTAIGTAVVTTGVRATVSGALVRAARHAGCATVGGADAALVVACFVQGGFGHEWISLSSSDAVSRRCPIPMPRSPTPPVGVGRLRRSAG
jgi:hypothetical protein